MSRQSARSKARLALTQNAGGWHGSDNVASVVHIFGGLAA